MQTETKSNNKKRNWGWILLAIGILCGLSKGPEYFNQDAALKAKLDSVSMQTVMELNLTDKQNQDALRANIKEDAGIGLVICSIFAVVGASLLFIHYKTKRG
jgi:hypothetical protein